MLVALFLSPVLMIVVAAGVVLYARTAQLAKPSIGYLVSRSIGFAVIGAVASLLLTIGWMIWYERSTGYSAGNAPLGWIFFYGPLSAACGQLAALIAWWLKTSAM